MRHEVHGVKAEYELMMYSISTDKSSFLDLKLQDWYDFEQLFSETLSDIREEV